MHLLNKLLLKQTTIFINLYSDSDSSDSDSKKLSHSKHTHGEKCTCTKCQNISITKDDVRKHDRNHISDKNEDPWIAYNEEFAEIVSQLYEDLDNDKVKPSDAATILNNLLTEFLESKTEIVKEVNTFYKHTPNAFNDLENAKKLKIELEKKTRHKDATPDDRIAASQALKHYSYLLKEKKEIDDSKETKEQERQYKRNFHKFAKTVTKGEYGKEEISPTFTKGTADKFFYR